MSKPKKSPEALILVISPAPNGIDLYKAHLENHDHILCISRTPFFDAARKLVAIDYDPDVTLILRHAGSSIDSLCAPLGIAVCLTVEETKYGARFRSWKPISTPEGTAKIAPGRPPATTLAEAPKISCERPSVDPPRDQRMALRGRP
jgi:hypothetical protein